MMEQIVVESKEWALLSRPFYFYVLLFNEKYNNWAQQWICSFSGVKRLNEDTVKPVSEFAVAPFYGRPVEYLLQARQTET